jgi:hypothetical protein
MSKKKGLKAEEKFIKTINSGAFNRDGDAVSDNYALEIKYTEKKGYRITSDTLQKIWEEALDHNKLPVFGVIIEQERERWILKVDVVKENK